LWDGRFEKYYGRTTTQRAGLEGGEHGPKAVEHLAQYIRQRTAAPGYSNHNTATAIDFGTRQGGITLGADTGKQSIDRWKRSWLYDWLETKKNASRFGFAPYTKEPWHWDYRGSGVRELEISPENLEGGETFSRLLRNGESAMEWQLETSTRRNDTPRLMKREDQPIGQSLYVRIPLGTEGPAEPITGIYLPVGYRPGPQVDLILYLHGYKLYGYDPQMSVTSYWNPARIPYFSLRQQLAMARKNVVLVVPTLGAKSQAGWLIGPNGLDQYLQQIVAALTAYGPFRGVPNPTVENIVLACHSGGGSPMRRLALSKQPSSARIRECWGFDCLYNAGDPALWASWASQDERRRLYIYYLRSTERLSRTLQAKNLPNVIVQQSSRGHNWVPINHWRQRINEARFLKDVVIS
jgi:hypothetical protein